MAIKHVVLFQWKEGTSDEQIADIFKALAGLDQLIPGIEEFVGGPYSSPEEMNKEFTHGFIMTFTDSAARDAYLPHPEHERVKGQIFPHLENVVAFDFEVG